MEFIKIVIGIACLVFSLNIQAQGKFYNTYSNNGHDFGEGVVQLPDSSYLITGASSSFQDAPAKAFILKVDKFGNRIWSKPYGGPESNRGRRIMHVENDGIYVAGYSNSFSNGSFDFYFFKTDLTGNLIYENSIGGPNLEKLHDAIMVPADTSFILVGETKSNPTETENLYIVRLNSNGDTIWTKQIGSAGADIARGVEMISDTTFVIVGDYYVADSLQQKALFMKMHINGTVEWLKTTGPDGNYSLNDVALDDGLIRGVGYRQYTENGVNYSKLYTFIAQLNGTTIIEKIAVLPGIFMRYGYFTSYSTQTNKFYISEQSTQGITPNFSGGGEDAKISKGEGYLYWMGEGVEVSSFGDDQITQLIRTSDGGAVAVGYNSNGGTGGNNITLMKIGDNDDFLAHFTAPNEGSLVFKDELDDAFKVKIYPNPVEEVLQIEVETLENVKVVVMNSLGTVISKEQFNKLTSIDLSNYANGLYMVQLEIAGELKSFKVLKK